MKKKIEKPGVNGTAITGCHFTIQFPQITPEARDAIIAIARASQTHSEALAALAKVLSGGTFSDIAAITMKGGDVT